ncbi:MAG: D-glycero-beta-D-manno-heptose 1,7-bisphosphate 7-phosphatase [Chloroflexi bacterium]|nr:D-glycero-beta-D-manno-heptose 1,7-bisphosphate 7-phosphatase [Chloroflexota bacterium]
MSQRRAIFLDRDGVINVNRSDYVKSWDEFIFLPRTFEALRRIAPSDFVIVVTTNQAAIARGLTTEATVRDIHARMIAAVQTAEGRIDAVYFCAHHPDEKCACRKPEPGMFHFAADDFDLDLTQSFVVGDAWSDISAAQTIGAQPILVLTGRGQEQHAQMLKENRTGFCVVDDLLSAVEWIAQQEKILL